LRAADDRWRADATWCAIVTGADTERPVRGLLLDITPLRAREFRLLFLGQLVSFFGSMITFVALPFQMYELTGSTLAVGALGACEFVPIVTVALVSGALADAFDRRKLVLVSELGSAVVMAALLGNSLLGQPHVWVLFVCATALAGFYALLRPPLDSLVPRVVPREQLKAAMALEWVRGNVGMIAGPALGGVLIAAFGVSLTYGIDLTTFVISLAFLAAMRASPPPPDAERPSLRSIAEGLRYAGSRPELLGTYLVDINAMFFGMPQALFPAIAAGYGGAAVLGLLYAAPAAGSIVIALLSGWTRHVHRHGRAVALAACGWGLAIIAFGFTDVLWLALLCLAVAGAMDAISGLFRSVIWNETIPDRLRGRLAGVEMISYTSGPTLGNFEAGVVASFAGVRTSIVSGGIMCVVGTGVVLAFLPAFWRYDARELHRQGRP
jgi:MFS family permease